MANITGENGNDTLTGTAEDDAIKGLNGNDLIIASDGNDVIDGGAGNDTVDYSNNGRNNNQALFGSLDGSITVTHQQAIGDESFRDKLVNVETIIGRKQSKDSAQNILSFNSDQPLDVDLSKNRVVYSPSSSSGSKTITVKNFSRVTAIGNGNFRIKGDDLDNLFEIGGPGEKTILGSKGNDTIVAVNGTIDYSNIGRKISLNIPDTFKVPQGVRSDVELKVDKGDSGVDKISRFKKIVGAKNQANTIDATTANFGIKLDVNLKNNSLNIVIPPDRIFDEKITKYEVVNFTNVVGGIYNDSIVGGNKNSKLTGGGGNDTITGGDKNDTITGSDSTARGVGEVDTLTGGGGRDKFVLGDKNGAYYVGKCKDDYALITDFNLFQDSIDLGGFKNYSFASAGNNTIELYSGKDVNTRDLIAKIQIAGGISNRSTNSRSVMGADASLNAITSKIDILSGSSSTADA